METETPIARMVREAIETVATPDVRVQILHRALHMAREHEIPKSGTSLHRFLESHLPTAMAFYLGSEAAEAVMANLEPMVSYAEKATSSAPGISSQQDETKKLGRDRQRSGVNRRDVDPSTLETSKYPTVQPSGSALPMVFVATKNKTRCTDIAKRVGSAAAVQQVEDVVAFLDNLKATASLSPMVVIDCVEASVQPSTIATLAHELPRGSSVLVWGASDKHRELVDLATSERWVRCGAEATPNDVAALIHMLLGQ